MQSTQIITPPKALTQNLIKTEIRGAEAAAKGVNLVYFVMETEDCNKKRNKKSRQGKRKKKEDKR